jgi:hypothetical protein
MNTDGLLATMTRKKKRGDGGHLQMALDEAYDLTSEMLAR